MVLPQPVLPPRSSQASPLTSAPDSSCRDLPGENEAQRNRSVSGATTKQDMYIAMDRFCEMPHGHSDSKIKWNEREAPAKIAADIREVETDRYFMCSAVMQSGGEYVKFCKDTFWLEPHSDKLRKQLEDELTLNSTNLKSHAWYHGPVPWEVSESLVANQGDFLIRDSQSSPGDFVLTCHWEQKILHFLIRKTVVQSSETFTRVQFSLEHKTFDSVPALVHHHVGSNSALTRCSGAQIHRPANRTLPISFLEEAFCTTGGPQCHQKSEEEEEERVQPNSPSFPQHQRTEEHNSTGKPYFSSPYTSPSKNPFSSQALSLSPSPDVSKCSVTTGPYSSPSAMLHRQYLRIPAMTQDSPPASYKDGSAYTQPHPQTFVKRLQAMECSMNADPRRLDDGNVFLPVVETVSSFKPSKYRSQLISRENKPLEVSILRRVKELLMEVDPRKAASHITKNDCMLARIMEGTLEMQKMMGVGSGMELLTLQHGQQLRRDLLERFHTMSITLAVDVLGCTGTNEERAALLHKVIQIAAELKTTMGNMFGFAAVMRALEMPQVSRLEQTWMALRRRHTEGAILYEKTLRPFLNSLNDGRESCPLSNTTFPHVLPLLNLLEKTSAMGEGMGPWECGEVNVDAVMFHLGAARTIAQLGGIYRSNAESKLQGFQEQSEIRELFLTDFQMRLLWGSKGAEENQTFRFSKFHQVLTTLSNRLEPPARRV
uniref:SH2 domain containing 3Cb n=3 Tax=Nothobranchius kuhntae TaxID=321403 RepID=A0A1A8I4H1_NOTKU